MYCNTFSPVYIQVSVIVGQKTLFLYDLDNAENPIELAFQPRYGEIVSYKWLVTSQSCGIFWISVFNRYGDGYIMIGFSNGFFVVISTDKSEIGQVNAYTLPSS